MQTSQSTQLYKSKSYYYTIIIIFQPRSTNQRLHVISHRILSDSLSSHVSRTLHSIQAYLNNAVVCMVSTRPLISNSSNAFFKPLETVTSAPITIGITTTLMLFSSQATPKYFSFVSLVNLIWFYLLDQSI